jgi:adenosylcobinamide kinase (EC 2.7.1.156)
MREIIFITGGQRSGKSSFAQGLAESYSARPCYLATARIWDDEFKQRIERHQRDRGEMWQTIEVEKRIGDVKMEGEAILLDCITLWLTIYTATTTLMLNFRLKRTKREWNKFTSQESTLIVVSNEIGMSLHGADKCSRDFTDLQGWMNQHIAKSADKVILMISGVPVTIKNN